MPDDSDNEWRDGKARESEDDSMISCEVTGKPTPRGDVVEFQGKMVSAEGKAVLLRELANPDGKLADLPRPTFGRRLMCYAIDYLVLMVVAAATSFLLYSLHYRLYHHPYFRRDDVVGFTPVIGMILAFLPSVAVCIFETFMISRWGQTPGKMVGGIRVIDMQGGPVGIGSALVRSLFTTGYIFILLFWYVFPERPATARILSITYILANALALVLDHKTNRAIHDRIAGTRVVRLGAAQTKARASAEEEAPEGRAL